MQKTIAFILFAMSLASATAQTIEDVYREFQSVPDSTRTKVWWFHGEDTTTREGITADLEAYKEAGVGGVVYYDQQHGPGTSASLKAMSPEWWSMLKFAAQEAKRLGLSFDVNISNGYCCGGPWITPELGMQCVKSTEVIVKGGEHFHAKLPDVGKKALEDIAVLAWPVIPEDTETVNCLPNGITVYRDTTILLYSSPSRSDRGGLFRSLSYNMDGWSKGAQSIINIPCEPQEEFFGDRFTWQPPIGELEVSDDSIHWCTVTTLHSIYRAHSLRPDYTISFPAATGRYFRLHLHDWTPQADGWVSVNGEWVKDQNASGKQKPLTLKSLTLSSVARIDRWEERAACFTEYIRSSQTPAYNSDEIIVKNKLLDVTKYMNAQGVLDWTAPEGCDWRVVRFTNCHTGGASKHGRPNLLGPETDKLSARAAEVHWQHYPQQILDTLRSIGCQVGNVCMDSHEAGSQNWTHDMPQLFREKYGYDIIPWLPAMQGYIVGSVAETEQFLRDLRRCIADGINDRYISTLQRLCTENGVQFTCQATGNGQSICSDNLAAKGRVDRPQGEFWTRHHDGSYDTREAASAAHLYGKTIASAEAFTDFCYDNYFDSVKDEIDMETAMQVNEFVVCASEYQPFVSPDSIMTGYNRDYALNRKNTLWPFARPFFDYQARNHYMMRQGRPVVDILVYVGDDAPMKMLAHRLPQIPEGYDFEVCSTDGLRQPNVLNYKLLAIEKSAVVRPETEKLIEQLKAKGLQVFDNRTMPDDAIGQVLTNAGIRPDVAIKSRRTALDRVFTTHRQTQDADIYFFVNHSKEHTFADSIVLRTDYGEAEWWDAITGKRYRLHSHSGKDGLHTLLYLRPNEAGFIVARQKAAKDISSLTFSPPLGELEGTPITGPWTVTFDQTLGGPDKPVVFKELTDWTQSDNPDIRYFSGLATYKKNLSLPLPKRGERVLLRMSGLQGVARVIVNSKDAGIVWCSPFEADITPYVKKGKNHIKIEVRNSLVNRLVGDASLPKAERHTWLFTPLYTEKSRLVPSGLTGTVEIITTSEK